MEPLGYDTGDPRLVPTASAFAEGLVEAAAGTGLRVVFGVEPGALGTVTVDVNFESASTVDCTSPISRAKDLAMRGESVLVLLAGVEPLFEGWEALRRAMALNLDLKVAQLSGGTLKGEDDPTPAVVEDFGILGTIPRLPLISPADAREARAVGRWCANQPGSAYIRLSTWPSPVFSKQFIGFNHGIAGILTRQGWDLTVLGTGPLVGTLVRLIEDFELEQISARIVNVSTLRPFDSSAIQRAAQDTRRLLTVEDHRLSCGLYAAAARALAEEALPHRLRGVGILDERLPDPPPPDPLRYYRLRAEDIFAAAKNLLQSEM